MKSFECNVQEAAFGAHLQQMQLRDRLEFLLFQRLQTEHERTCLQSLTI
jgi:hypothetical protein